MEKEGLSVLIYRGTSLIVLHSFVNVEDVIAQGLGGCNRLSLETLHKTSAILKSAGRRSVGIHSAKCCSLGHIMIIVEIS